MLDGLKAFRTEYKHRRATGRPRLYSLELAAYAAWCAVRVTPTEGHWTQYTPPFWRKVHLTAMRLGVRYA